MNKELIARLGFALGGAAAGTGVTYLVLKKHFQRLADEEVQSVKDKYKILRKEGQLATPESAAEHLKELREEKEEVEKEVEEYVGELAALGYVKQPSDEDMEDNNLTPAPFTSGDKVSRYTVTDKPLPFVDQMNLEEPYVIRVDQFHEPFENHEKVSIMFYTKDKVLVDEREMPIGNISATVGPENLDRFGEGSDDPEIVYIRNHKLGLDMEVTRSGNSYAESVWNAEEESTENDE